MHLTVSGLDAIDPHEAAAHSMLGMGALLAELAAQGVPAQALLLGTGLTPRQFTDPQARMSQSQKVAIFRNARRLSAAADLGLRAGARQRLSDFGVYGYALVSSPTFGDAVALGVRHIKLAGPVLEKHFRVEGGTAIFEGRDPFALGELLPLVSEYWFSSILRLITLVLEAPLPSHQLLLPYARPAHAAAYEQVFGCPVHFGADTMEWHFDAAVLGVPCPNANPITADLCKDMCERLLRTLPEESELERSIRAACFNSFGVFPALDEMAQRLGLSARTLQRRLTETGRHYQEIIDEVRTALAIEFLSQTTLSVEEVAQRVGFSDASNFRKAFRKWTGQPPAHYRSARQADEATA
ncbi:AraC family transcriptional regulator [Xenophilus arseniciresistens]|uniref:AraC family transcriptional regulator n=1 Tax=Xenophilus arseniciresistens TaxID=1283306 RepID=A0AAE3T1H9_9BURK|nr:AraC family transcriptional regulator [Xenophilus arseniciresistens]MDA7418595.1 AraC family transcriptional regulator [Xenophilus arseniciresistens]